MNKDLKILQKTYDMIVYGNICLKEFPKHEKHVMAANIRSSMYRLLELIVRANKKYHKKTTLQDIDIELELLRTYIRFSTDPKVRYLTLRKYENWSKMLNEIGRMLGGWMKSVK
ncbi:diversity-generating retroelement protein Avd [Clostridium formicaceticum]|uniref:Four helix bundle protein n=1 Tax=Clostridium formicaceticum TaxID=1497 RepID=A0AAC9RLV0_9CLOT|nr:diversity-generating retroelement protein Avd [Clostridium formicaceticum]AOY77178.1 four helix bundle protein [Clostridium formicaceticum]ARE87700.1 hypothetical protein CLFO_21000 [Clostridium formicaceticum]